MAGVSFSNEGDRRSFLVSVLMLCVGGRRFAAIFFAGCAGDQNEMLFVEI